MPRTQRLDERRRRGPRAARRAAALEAHPRRCTRRRPPRAWPAAARRSARARDAGVAGPRTSIVSSCTSSTPATRVADDDGLARPRAQRARRWRGDPSRARWRGGTAPAHRVAWRRARHEMGPSSGLAGVAVSPRSRTSTMRASSGAARPTVIPMVPDLDRKQRQRRHEPARPGGDEPESAASPRRASEQDVRELVVPESLDGARLDKAIAQLVPELSRARVKRAIELGAVRVNGRRVPKGGSVARRGRAADRRRAGRGRRRQWRRPDAPLKVVLETAEVVVVDKPAGQPTAPIRPGETGTLVNALLGRYPELVPARGTRTSATRRATPASCIDSTPRRAAPSSSRAPRRRSTTLKAALRGRPARQALSARLRRRGAARRGDHRVPSHQPPEGPAARLRLHAPAGRHAVRAAPRGHALQGPAPRRATGRSSRRAWARRCATRSARTSRPSGTRSPATSSTAGPSFARSVGTRFTRRRSRFSGGGGLAAFDVTRASAEGHGDAARGRRGRRERDVLAESGARDEPAAHARAGLRRSLRTARALPSRPVQRNRPHAYGARLLA